MKSGFANNSTTSYSGRKGELVFICSDVHESPMLNSILQRINEEKMLSHIFAIGNQMPFFLATCPKLSRVTTVIKFERFRFNLIEFLKLLRYVKKNRPRILLCNGRRAALLGIALRILLISARLINIRRYGSIHHNGRNTRALFVDVLMGFFFSHQIVVSACVKTLLQKKEYVPLSRMTVIHDGIDTDMLDSYVVAGPKHYPKKKSHPFQILVVSRTDYWKNVHLIVGAFNSFIKSWPDAKLTLIGPQGDFDLEVNRLLAKLDTRNYERICHHVNVFPYIRETDLFIHVPEKPCAEAFGLVYLEAIYLGASALFSKSGIINEIPETLRAYDVQHELTEQAILASLTRLRQLKFDSETNKLKLRRYIKTNYSLQRVSDEYLSFLSQNM